MNDRKERRRERDIHERWLLHYSDLVTLLLAFFIIVFAMTDINKQKFNTFAQNINHTFFGKSIQTPAQRAEEVLQSYTSGKLTEEKSWEDMNTYAFSDGENIYLVKMNPQSGDVQNIASLKEIK